ncbi:MAG: hypothetical protein RLW61_03490 [Gammaproteobacteria bacterium]
MTLMLAALGLALAACATKPQQLDQSFWQEQSSKKVAIVIAKLPDKGALYKEGGQGLLDMAISSVATQGVSRHLATLSADTFLEIRGELAERLRADGFEVVQHEPFVDLDQLPKTSGDGLFERDLASVANATGADRIILFRLYQFGASRAYYGFIPISAPQGLAAVYGAMVDARTNKLMWHTGDSLKDAFIKEPVVGEWKEPPDYPNLTAAATRALEKSRRVMIAKFFSK